MVHPHRRLDRFPRSSSRRSSTRRLSPLSGARSLSLALPSQCLLPPRLPIAIPRLPLAIRPASVARPASLAIAISAAIARVAAIAPAIGFASADARADHHTPLRTLARRGRSATLAGIGSTIARGTISGRAVSGRAVSGRAVSGRAVTRRTVSWRAVSGGPSLGGPLPGGGPRAGSTRATGWDSCARSVRAGRT